MRTSRHNSRPGAAFTLVEIAIALAVIAFALVAIIGIIPAGLQVQKDNREDTIINQDAAYLLEAVRTGSPGLYDLAEFAIEVDGAPVGNQLTSAEILSILASNGVHTVIMNNITGAAALRGSPLALTYEVTVDVRNAAIGTNSPARLQVEENLREIRMLVRWPALPSGSSWRIPDASSRRVFRTLAAGSYVASTNSGLVHLNPNVFTKP